MKKLNFTITLLLYIANIAAQEDLKKNAIFHAELMAKYYNLKDFQKYVDYLEPGQYGNNVENKENYSKMWQSIMESDTSSLKITKLVEFKISNKQQQALFQISFHNDGYIFGTSSTEGQNWFFTQALSNALNFETVLSMVPTLDTSFAKLVDSKYGKRINYEIEKSIAPFNYTDINGNILNSELLKGKLIVLNFWSPSCGPCILEMPELNNMIERMKGKDIVFIAPAAYTTKDMLINSFLIKHPFKYQIVIIDGDDYNVVSFPTHIIIDQNHIVIERLSGYSSESVKMLEKKINQILK